MRATGIYRLWWAQRALFRQHLYANYRGREPTISHQLEVERGGEGRNRTA
jgi:hypothetical protein